MTGSSDFDRLQADLGRVRGVAPLVKVAVERTARRIKDDWNSHLYHEGHARLTSGSVTYDMKNQAGARGGSDITAEIGPELHRGRQAAIAGLIETGSVHNPPHGYGAAALHRNEDDFHHGLEEAVAEALRRLGGF
jgi:hypothetical protein